MRLSMDSSYSSIFLIKGDAPPVWFDAGITKIQIVGDKHKATLIAHLPKAAPLVNFEDGVILDITWSTDKEISIDEHQKDIVAIRLANCTLVDRWIENVIPTNEILGDMMVHAIIECVATISPWVFE